MKKRIAVFLLGVLMILSSCSQTEQKAEKDHAPDFVFTYAENQAEDYPTTKGAYRFAELVKERSGGRIEILVKSGGVLGDEKSVIEQMQFGGLDFARVSLSSLSEDVPKLKVLHLPYLYRNAAHMWEVLDGKIGDDFLRSFRGTNLVALSWYEAGSRNFYNSLRPIHRPEDMKGMKIRVQESELMLRMVEILGAYAVQTPYDQVYSALETRKIDGAENNWPSYESEKHYQVAKYYTVDEHARVPELQIVSRFTWNKLSKEDQKLIIACAQESSRYERQLWEDQVESSRKRLQEAGCEIVELTSTEKAVFQEKVRPLYREFCEEYSGIIDEIVSTGQESVPDS
ncbi:MAG: TRAP transporter substrate-binding protein [Brotaphodocola sp.]